MNKTLSISFHLRKDKRDRKGLIPIFMRLTIDGKKAEIFTKRGISLKSWSQSRRQVLGDTEEASSINYYLKALEREAYDKYTTLILSKKEVTAAILKDEILGTNNETRTLIQVFEMHNKRFAALIGEGADKYSPGTLERYITVAKHLQQFLKLRYGKSDIDIKAINYEFITEFEHFLRSTRQCNNNTSVKYLKNFKKIIRICLANGWIDRDPFINYKNRVKEVIRVVLNSEEIESLQNKVIHIDRLRVVRDMFVFSCYTGLAYADISRLQKSDISKGEEGDWWIRIRRKKTDTLSSIPILPVAMELLEQYRNHPNTNDKVFPAITNQKMNAYLKELADITSIEKHLTFHIARHTFATTVTLTNNVPIETVSRMLGHQSLRTTQHYAKVLDKKVSEDMKNLREKLDCRSEQKV